MDTVDILPTQDPEDAFDYMYQEGERLDNNKERMPEILQENAKRGINWLVFKIYYLLYANPLAPKEMHINRVRPMIETWLENTTYEQLVEGGIITEEDIIKNYK